MAGWRPISQESKGPLFRGKEVVSLINVRYSLTRLSKTLGPLSSNEADKYFQLMLAFALQDSTHTEYRAAYRRRGFPPIGNTLLIGYPIVVIAWQASSLLWNGSIAKITPAEPLEANLGLRMEGHERVLLQTYILCSSALLLTMQLVNHRTVSHWH